MSYKFWFITYQGHRITTQYVSSNKAELAQKANELRLKPASATAYALRVVTPEDEIYDFVYGKKNWYHRGHFGLK